MREVHGVVAKRAEFVTADDECVVRISDADNFIVLYIPHDRNPALTVEEARFLARQLTLAAIRLEAKKKK